MLSIRLPRGFWALILIQSCSIFAFSILYSTLVLYTTNALKISDSVSVGIIASFFAFNYVLHLLGGLMGGRLFSNRVLLALGIMCQLTGCALISIPTLNTLYWGLAVYIIGTGTSSTCANCMLTQLFEAHDKRRETAFMIMYSGINVCYFIGFSISGYFQLHSAYRELLMLGCLGSFFTLLVIAWNWKVLADKASALGKLPATQKLIANSKGILIIAALIPLLRWLFERAHFTNNLILIISLCMAALISVLAIRQREIEARHKMWAYLVFALAALVFWTLYQIAPMALTLFIQRNVDPHYLGFIIAPQWVRNVNSIVVVLGAPVLGLLFNVLRGRGYNITLPLQFSIAMFLIGISFLLLPLGIYYANAQGYVAMSWIVFSYIIQSIGELFISPIGYAMVGQLAPAHLQGLLMGTWLMLTGLASSVSWYFSSMALGNSQSIDPLITNSSFSYTFGLLGIIAVITGFILMVLIPLLLHLTREKDQRDFATVLLP